MSDLSLFYSSMSSVLNQWSDFRVSKNLYKPYFEMQKANAKSSAESAAESLKKNSETKKTTSKSTVTDKLKTYSGNVTSSVSKLESALKADSKTGEINYENAYSAASDFVSSYNELYSATRQSGNSSLSGRSEYMNNMASIYNNSKFEKVGISMDSTGKLSLDKEAFMSATEDELNDVFGKDRSFASIVNSQASSLAKYADTAEYQSGGSTYTRAGTVASASNASAVSGMIYNGLF